MALPIRTTIEDVQAVCGYLATKPTGATVAEAKAVLDSGVLDGRKVSALKYWGLVDDESDKMRLTEFGRQLAKDKFAKMASVIRDRIAHLAPYSAIVERAVHRKEFQVTATEVAAHWHEHFKDVVSENDKILNDQAVCFFQLAQGADLGQLTIGRKGQPTRFDFSEEVAASFVQNGGFQGTASPSDVVVDKGQTGSTVTELFGKSDVKVDAKIMGGAEKNNRVFITHGKNKKILDQVKEIVAFGKFEAVVAQERETPAKPVPEKVMDDMRACSAAVIHVCVEGILTDKDGANIPQINGNVLIEIGAAMALYGKNFILLVEEGVQLPSNLQGLYECRYKGDELNMEATMKLLKAFNAFR